MGKILSQYICVFNTLISYNFNSQLYVNSPLKTLLLTNNINQLIISETSKRICVWSWVYYDGITSHFVPGNIQEITIHGEELNLSSNAIWEQL